MIAILQDISKFAIPVFIVFILGFGFYKKIPVYETFVEGAKEGLQLLSALCPIRWPCWRRRYSAPPVPWSLINVLPNPAAGTPSCSPPSAAHVRSSFPTFRQSF